MSANKYDYLIVESFIPTRTSGRHGKVHVRPVQGQEGYSPELFVECSKELSENYPVRTKFQLKIKSELSRKMGGKEYVSSSGAGDIPC